MKIIILISLLPFMIINANTDSVKVFVKKNYEYIRNSQWTEVAEMYRKGDLEYYKSCMQKVINADLEFRNGFIEMGMDLSELQSLNPVDYFAKIMKSSFSKMLDLNIKIDSIVVVGVIEEKKNQFNCILNLYMSKDDKQVSAKDIEEVIYEDNHYYMLFNQDIKSKLEKYNNYEYNDIYAVNYDTDIENDVLVTTCPEAKEGTSYSSEYAEIASINLKTGRLTRLTKDLSKDSDPNWYPDKSKIFFTSKRPFKTYLAENGSDNIFYINRKNGLIINFSDSIKNRFPGSLGMELSKPIWSKDKKLAFITKNYSDDNFIDKLNLYVEHENKLFTIDSSYSIDDFKWNCNGEYLYFESGDKDFHSKKYIYCYSNKSKNSIDNISNNYKFVDWIPNSKSPIFQVNDTLSASIKLYKYDLDKNSFSEVKALKNINGTIKAVFDNFTKFLVLVEEAGHVNALYIDDVSTNTQKKIYESKKMLQDISY